MQAQTKTADFSELALEYERYRIGYSPELYEVIKSYGLPRGGKILDVASGTGLSAEAFAAQGYDVTGIDPSAAMIEHARARIPGATFIEGSAEKLPFEDGSFDAVTCAQAFHWFNTLPVMNEFIRVTKSRGLVSIWWKHLVQEDPIRIVRSAVYGEMGKADLAEPAHTGFTAFYGAPFKDRHVRVLRFPQLTTVERYLGYERSRMNAHTHFGENIDEYFKRLEAGLVAKFGSREAQAWVTYVIYLYVGVVA